MPGREYLLVEIENPKRQLFKQDGHAHHELNHAINQVRDWLRYIVDNLQTVRQELELTHLTATPQCLVVIGRDSQLTEKNRRDLQATQSQFNNLRIETYDSLLERAKTNVENMLGPLIDSNPGTQMYFREKGMQ